MTTSQTTWRIPPQAVSFTIGTGALDSYEDQHAVHETVAALEQTGEALAYVRQLDYGGHTVVCRDRAAADALARQLRRLPLSLAIGAPRAGLRETVGQARTVRGRWVRQTGGPGQFGIVDLLVAPLPGAGLVRFRSALSGAEPISPFYIPAIARGVWEAVCADGPQGHPLADLDVTLVGGAEHPVDSRASSFTRAARLALRGALEQAGLVVRAR